VEFCAVALRANNKVLVLDFNVSRSGRTTRETGRCRCRRRSSMGRERSVASPVAKLKERVDGVHDSSCKCEDLQNATYSSSTVNIMQRRCVRGLDHRCKKRFRKK